MVTLDAAELRTSLAALPTPQGIVSAHLVEAAPLDNSMDTVGKICVRVDGYRLFSWMERTEQESYFAMLDNLKQNLRRQRLQKEAGITAPAPGGGRGRIIS